MKIAVVYVYPICLGPAYEQYALRFLNSYRANPPGTDHQSVIVLNGGRSSSELFCLFSAMPNFLILEHDNSGYDIGAFQFAARKIPCDMMVFFGASTFFKRSGWLLRMASSFQSHGNALYGAMGNKGDAAVAVWPHIRTTAFWMKPELMNAYPVIVTRPEQRHPFEHGKDCLTSWVRAQGLAAWVVTWNYEFLWAHWDDDPNGFQRGNQSSLLAGDHICEPPYYPRRR